jgi:hypothetical protein
LAEVAELSAGFSGAESEQVVVSALYQSVASDEQVDAAMLLVEIEKARALSIVMLEQISQLQTWAQNRTLPAN